MRFKPKINSQPFYYVGVDGIEEVSTIRDLGVTFDSALTLKQHIAAITVKLNQLTAVVYRFAKEIHHPELLRKIEITYLYPVAEYCSTIWSQRRITAERQIDKCLHSITRTALHLPYQSHHPQYLNHRTRLRMLNMLSLGERRVISSVILINRLYKDEIQTQLSHWIRAHRNQVIRTRNSLLFVYGRNEIAFRSPIAICIHECNTHRLLFDINEATGTTRNNMKKHFFDN